jgi:hypothetical protein
MAYAAGTPEADLQQAQARLEQAIEDVARFSGAVSDGYVLTDWVVVGAATKIEDMSNTTMFTIPGQAMSTWQLHGLLSYADYWITNDLDTNNDDEN